MAFSTQCDNKGCFDLQTPYLDPLTNKVHCATCDNEIKNISQFVKTQMKMSKQFKPVDKTFSIRCDKCKTQARPKKQAGNYICVFCGTTFSKLTSHFKLMLDQFSDFNSDE